MTGSNSNSVNFVFVLGRPGSGKDTQIDMYLKDSPAAVKISAGEIFRRGQNPNDKEYGRYYSLVHPHDEKVRKGEFISGDAISTAIQEAVFLSLHEGKKSFVISGHPRGISHLKGTDSIIKTLENLGYNVRSLFIYLGTPEEEARRRMSRRMETESLETGFPRPDDMPEAKNRRLEVFEEQTWPMLKEVLERSKTPDAKTRLCIIRGNRSTQEVHQVFSKELISFLTEGSSQESGAETE